ncbi:MAG TPA: hypothetical protein VF820_00580 [Patescibacteria group bacterium]
MGNPEFEPERTEAEVAEVKRRKIENAEKKQEENESGYSEKEQALDIEMRTGDLSALKKSKAYQSLSASGKALVAYKTVSNKLGYLLEVYAKLSIADLHRAQKLMAEIAQLRILQSLLFNKLIGKTEAELDRSLLPNDLSDFV